MGRRVWPRRAVFLMLTIGLLHHDAIGVTQSAAAASPSPLERVSLGPRGEQLGSARSPALSDDGIVLAFTSGDVFPDDIDSKAQVYVRDLQTGEVERVSQDATGSPADGYSDWPAVSADGSRVLFASDGINMPAAESGETRMYVKDRVEGSLRVASIGIDGSIRADSGSGRISADGNHVLFSAGHRQLYVRDLVSETTRLVSVPADGEDWTNRWVFGGDLSGDGRLVALLTWDQDASSALYLHDAASETTVRLDIDELGSDATIQQGSVRISDDGQRVLFMAPVGGSMGAFVLDRGTGQILTANEAPTGAIAGADGPAELSASGSAVSYLSTAPATDDDAGTTKDVFVRYLNGGTRRVTRATDGWSTGPSAAIASSGERVVFMSDDSNIVNDDTNGGSDLFLADGLTSAIAKTQFVDSNEDIPLAVALEVENPAALALEWTIEMAPGHGHLEGTAPDLVYVPAQNFNGTDAFTFSIRDEHGRTSLGGIVIRVAAVDDALVATGLAVRVGPAGNAAFEVPIMDADGDASYVAGWANGATVVIDGRTVTYTAPRYPEETESFEISGYDAGSYVTAMVTVTFTQQPTTIDAEPLFAALASRTNPRLSARLKDEAGDPLPRAPVTFEAGGAVVCTTFTGDDGVASCDSLPAIFRSAAALSYRATFPGTARYTMSTDTAGTPFDR